MADEPEPFAKKVARLLADEDEARSIAERARAYVTEHRNMTTMTHKLEESFRKAVLQKRMKAI